MMQPLLVAPVRAVARRRGSAPGLGDTQIDAFVIDMRGMPPGTVLQLDNIDFAAIIGGGSVDGGAGDDTLRGGQGDDLLYGGDGADVFAVGEDGVDLVADFDATQGDRIRVLAGGGTGIESFADLLAAAADDGTGGVTIGLGGAVLRIAGTSVAALREDWFLLA